MSDPPKVSVKKYKVKVAGSSPALPPKPPQVSRNNSHGSPIVSRANVPTRGTPSSRGSAPPARGAAAAAFAAQQQRQQAALLRQQQLYAQQRAQQQYANLTPQQKAQLQYQQQLRAQQAALNKQNNNAQQQYANLTPQQKAQLQYQQQLRAQQAALNQQRLRQQQAAAASNRTTQQNNNNVSSSNITPPKTTAQLQAQLNKRLSQKQMAPQPTLNSSPSTESIKETPKPTTPTAPTPSPKPPAIPSKPSIPAKPTIVEKPAPSLPSKPKGKEIELHWPSDKTPFEKPDDSSLIVYEQKEDEISKPKIKAATIEKLIEKATSYNADVLLQKTLLLTYRSMISPEELLDFLMLRFSMPLPEGNEASVEAFKLKKQKPIQVRVCQLLKTWITKYFHDFENNEDLQQKLLNFCSNIIKPVCPPGASLENITQRKLTGEYDKDKTIQYTDPPPEPILPQIPRPSFLDIHPMEIARQLTIIESNLYRAIRPQECIGLAWSKKDAATRAPNILKMINRFNTVSNWVVSEILKQDTKKLRVDTLNHFIEIAERCKGLNNLNACMEIISGLGDSSVHRLKTHWADLPKKSQTLYQELKVILSSETNYKNFRAYLKTIHGACIPYLGMYLTDLTFIEDGNKDKLGELHNFSKRIFISNVIQEIQQYQQAPYILKAVPAIQNFFNALQDKIIDKEECYQISLRILPRGGAKTNASQTSVPKKATDDYGEMQNKPGYAFLDADTPKNIKLQKNPNDPTGPPKVMGGTLAKVVERITYKTFPEAQLVSAFLLTYREYTTGKELMNLLIMRFNMPLPIDSAQMERFKKEQLLPVQLRVLNVLKNWVENYPYDFVLEKPLANMFFNFVNTSSTTMHGASLKRIAKTLKQKTSKNAKELNRRATVSHAPPPSQMDLQPGADVSNLKFLDFHPTEVARQICLYDFGIYSAIQPLEMINCTYLSDPKKARNIIQLKRRKDALKNWVINQIITIEASNRRKMLTQIICIASSCYELHNFNAVCGLFEGLQSPEVTSLSQTWDSIDSKTIEKYNSIKAIASNLSSLRVFREHAKQDCADEPAIFLLESYLKEIETIEDRENPYIDNDMINMMRNRKLNASISEYLMNQNNPYIFESNSWLQTYIHKDITSFAARDGFSDQIPLSEQIALMDTTKIKTAIKERMIDDSQVKNELLKALKKGLLSEVASEELQVFKDQVESFKQKMRQELETVHEKFSRGTFAEDFAEEELSQKFGSDLDTLEDWILEDQEGSVYGWSERVTIPTLSSNGETFLIYQKKIFDKAELALFLRIRQFYSQYSGNESPIKLLAVSNYIAPNTRSFAEQKGVELICVS